MSNVHTYPIFKGTVTAVSLEYKGFHDDREPKCFSITAKTNPEQYGEERNFTIRVEAPVDQPPPAVGSKLTVSYQTTSLLGQAIQAALPIEVNDES